MWLMSHVNAKRYVETLLPRLLEECKSLLSPGFIFQQDVAYAYTAKLAENWIATNCSQFVGKDEWPPNLPDVMHLITSRELMSRELMREYYKTFHPKPNNTDGLKSCS